MHNSSPQLASPVASSSRETSPRIFPDASVHFDPSSSLSNKPSTSFTTSLAINVEGATPICSEEDNESIPLTRMGTPRQSSSTGSQRAPRKSKTEALAALHTHARSSSIGQDDSGYHDSEGNFIALPPPIPINATLDMTSVKTPSSVPLPPRTEPRPFGLEDCPTFFPTAEEFKDSMAYIRSISDRARSYGLCKIIPPEGWKMPFMTDTEVGCS
jgi:histone demethylase JARID1